MTAPQSSALVPQTVTEVLERLDAGADILPKRLKQCALFTRRHLHLIPVSTVSEMARASGVAPSAYMRFCQALGFSGYSEMQGLFRAQVTDFRPNYQDRLGNLRFQADVGTGQLLAEFAEAGHKSLLSLANSVTNEGLDRIARGMAQARVIHLIGLRRAYAVVSSMAYLLDKLEVPSSLHYASGMLNASGTIFEGDVVFAASFAPFSPETIRLARESSDRGIKVYGLTDSDNCPLNEFATEMLIAREDEVAGFRSLTASITLTTTLAVAIKAVQISVD